MEELRRLVLLEFQERKSNASSRGIFGRSRTAKILRRSKTKILRAVSRLNRIIQSTTWIMYQAPVFSGVIHLSVALSRFQNKITTM
ncbi:hypothetical protein TorRG33x02_017160 [Trema orientale]|uniref:Uncharacterized protein n=1 Tax=Trema orientale TaxID=63057 RepID=A0A2P5FY70_TREOI|nr:hypothetical protein TorRG33x02_017160 [Trema orientale]